MPIKHDHQSAAEDSAENVIQPSHWNADHDLTGMLAVLDAVAPTPNVVFTLNGSGQLQLLPFGSFAPSFSPAFTGVPTAPTPAAGVNTTQIATMEAVQTAITNLIGGAPGALDTLNELATAINDDAAFSATVTTALGVRLRVDAAQGLSGGQQAQGRSNLGLGTAAPLNVGTGANNVVQLDGSSKLPAVDGSQLTGIVFTGAVQYNSAQSLTAAQTLQARSNIAAASSPTSRTRTVLTTVGSGTYNVPTNCKALIVRMVGGGAGGGGTGTTPGAATAGGNTTFGSAFLTANGGGVGAGAAGIGGTATGGDINIRGGSGGGISTLANVSGGQGGGSAFGGEGAGGPQGGAGTAAATNSGSGGGSGGQGGSGGAANGGGGAGGYCEKMITAPAASYAYAVGAAGAAGTAGSGGFAGGAGAAGIIIIDEFY